MAGGGGCLCHLDTFLVLLYSPFSRHRAQLLLYYLTCNMCLRFRDCPVVLDIDELSVSARHQKTRVLCVRAASCAAACCSSSSERRCATQISILHAKRVKQNNEFGPIRAPENNDFWRPTTAKFPLPAAPKAHPLEKAFFSYKNPMDLRAARMNTRGAISHMPMVQPTKQPCTSPPGSRGQDSVSYTHLTLPTNREV